MEGKALRNDFNFLVRYIQLLQNLLHSFTCLVRQLQLSYISAGSSRAESERIICQEGGGTSEQCGATGLVICIDVAVWAAGLEETIEGDTRGRAILW